MSLFQEHSPVGFSNILKYNVFIYKAGGRNLARLSVYMIDVFSNRQAFLQALRPMERSRFMKRVIMVSILVLAVALAAPAFAFEKGTIRLGTGTGLLSSGSGFSQTSLSPDSGGDSDIDVLAFDLGYFLTDAVEIDFTYATVSIEGTDFDTLGVAGKYYFPMGANYLYAGGGFQTLDFAGGDGDAIFLSGGYTWMLKEYFSVDFYLNIGQGDIEGNDFDLTDIGITYSVYFK